jgi:hypothetical protein
MGIRKKRNSRTRRSDEEYDSTNHPADESSSSRLPFVSLFGVMVLTMMLSFLPHLVQYDTYGGKRRSDMERERKPFDEGVDSKISASLFRRIYRMKRESFEKLHGIIEPDLLSAFFPRGGGTRRPGSSNYLIDTKTHLATAIRYFCGADPYDLMRLCGVGYASVFWSVWVVIDVINKCDNLAYSFPDLKEQAEIARAFQSKSGAGFSCVIGAIDGLLIAIRKPAEYFCQMMNCGSASFRCHRKDKYGLNMQAIWIDINWPGASSDYMAWVTSDLCIKLEEAVHDVIAKGMTLLGDNAYCKRMFVATPLKGARRGYEDAYNFYHSQLRITIERAFGVLVHRWAILRAPLMIPLPKVAPLVECLVRLHNFCIDEKELRLHQFTRTTTPISVRMFDWPVTLHVLRMI